MCGRYSHSFVWSELPGRLNRTPELQFPDPEPSFNVCPTQDAPVLRAEGPGLLRWGLVPPWASPSHAKPINARAETAEKQPFFRSAFKRRRCIIPVSGFYEWTKVEGGKQPHYIYSKTGEPMLLAGLWEKKDELETFTILTCAANEFMQPIHHRMPVILTAEAAEHWLDAADPKLLVPWAGDDLASHPVSTRVNSARVNNATLIEPL